jgi:hypothetical protein
LTFRAIAYEPGDETDRHAIPLEHPDVVFIDMKVACCAVAMGALLVVATPGCGRPNQTVGQAVPTTVLGRNGIYQGSVPTRAATSIAQLQALLSITGGSPSECARDSVNPICWPDGKAPASSLLIAFSTGAVNDIVPDLTAKLDGARLTLENSYPGSGSNNARSTSVLETVAIPLSALPKAILTVVAPPYDRPPVYGRALVDLRDPLPTASPTSAVAELTNARDSAFTDARTRLHLGNTEFTIVDALGVMHWPDDALGCPGTTATTRTRTDGYVLFLVKSGVPVARELEYHSDGVKTLFCGFSR